MVRRKVWPPGAHHDAYPHCYLTAAAAIGATREELEAPSLQTREAGKFRNFLSNFGNVWLLFGCVGKDFCKWIFIVQHFCCTVPLHPRLAGARCSCNCCTALPSEVDQHLVKKVKLRKFRRCFLRFGVEFRIVSDRVWLRFVGSSRCRCESLCFKR